MRNNAIGVFDSGVGGLTVVKALKKHLPQENIIYLGDTARVPYGNKTKEEIIQYGFDSVEYLRSQGAKIVIMACNTSSALALEELRRAFPIPLFGVIEAGAKDAMWRTRNNHYGILATVATTNSHAYREAIFAEQSLAQVEEIPCPKWVDIIEREETETEEGKKLIRDTVAPLLEKPVDTIILGCTHYPVVLDQLKELFSDHNPAVEFIDPAEQTAIRAKKVLTESRILNDGMKEAVVDYRVTRETPHFVKNAKMILGEDIPEPTLVEVEGVGREKHEQFLSQRD